jgi:hypothetical protein
MKRDAVSLAVSTLMLILAGCSAMGVVATSDPHEKLRQAQYQLQDDQNRPIPAERLIREAIEIYREKGDEQGLAVGYLRYAEFFNSNSVGRWEPFYQKNGFMDKEAVFDKRWERSLEYLQKARDLYEKQSNYALLTYVDEEFALIYKHFKDHKNTCHYFE